MSSQGSDQLSQTNGERSDRVCLDPTCRFDVIHIDYGANLTRSLNGNSSYLIAVDVFTGNAIVYPIREPNSETMINFLEEIFARFDVPRIIVSDSSMQFHAQPYNDFMRRHNIIAVRNNCNFHVINSAERIIRQIRHMITALARNSVSWDENLQNLVNRALR